MTESPRPGRKSSIDYCLDCWREAGEPDDRPKGAGDKEVNSYCRKHHSKRVVKSQHKRKTTATTRREVTLGYWHEIPDTARGNLGVKFKEQIRLTYAQHASQRMATPYAFEFACVEFAILRMRKITRAEENGIIETFGGSRTGKSAYEPGAVEDSLGGPVLLPDPNVRVPFRAQGKGGPTTEGEPTFTEYYRQHNGVDPPVELSEADNRASSTSDEPMSLASDGFLVPTRHLAGYEKHYAGKPHTQVASIEDAPADMVPIDTFMQALQDVEGRHPLGGEDE
jgi:hypothetical protein